MDERSGRGCANDHVRLLTRNGLEHDTRIRCTAPRPDELVAVSVPSQGGSCAPVLVVRADVACSLQREQRRADEDERSDE